MKILNVSTALKTFKLLTTSVSVIGIKTGNANKFSFVLIDLSEALELQNKFLKNCWKY